MIIIYSLDFQLNNFEINIFVCLFVYSSIHYVLSIYLVSSYTVYNKRDKLNFQLNNWKTNTIRYRYIFL